MLEITARINETVKKYNMLSFGDSVVVGVSGGADSMLLLHYLQSVQDEWNLSLIVANVEHGIRGQESIRDTDFVRQYCKENHLRFETVSIDALSDAKKKGMSVEEYSRDVRYTFFRSFNADKIATAHNLSDNIETVLFRFSRGTTIKGCTGIPPVRRNIIRPLIEISSSEIREYCQANAIEYMIDSTNSNNQYSRNYIRNQIVKDFKNLNPSFEKVFARFIESVKNDESVLDHLANRAFDESFKKNALMIDKLCKYEPSIVKRVIVKYMSLYDTALDDLHLNGVYELLFKQGRYQIKNNLFAISDKKRLRTALFETTACFDDIKIERKVTSRADFLTNCELYRKNFDFYCDYDKIVDNISVRGRESGDEISPAGRNCTKSLKKLYNEYQIPVEERESVPVICDSKGLIGIYGYCCDERVKIDNVTTSVILLKIIKED